MALSKIIFITVIVVFVLLLIMFPEFRTLLSGFTRVFIKDMATTPDGAAAIYQEKINQAQDAYAKADDAYKRTAGKLNNAKKEKDLLQQRLVKVESECETLVKNNKLDMAQLKAEEREEILSDIKRYTELIKVFEQATSEAKQLQEMREQSLRRLKRESKEVVENMRVKKEMKEVYDDMDELKSMNATDKLLDSVREKNKDLDDIVEGSRVAHNNKTSTKLQKADAEAKRLQSNDYLESLKKKYNK